MFTLRWGPRPRRTQSTTHADHLQPPANVANGTKWDALNPQIQAVLEDIAYNQGGGGLHTLFGIAGAVTAISTNNVRAFNIALANFYISTATEHDRRLAEPDTSIPVPSRSILALPVPSKMIPVSLPWISPGRYQTTALKAITYFSHWPMAIPCRSLERLVEPSMERWFSPIT